MNEWKKNYSNDVILVSILMPFSLKLPWRDTRARKAKSVRPIAVAIIIIIVITIIVIVIIHRIRSQIGSCAAPIHSAEPRPWLNLSQYRGLTERAAFSKEPLVCLVPEATNPANFKEKGKLKIVSCLNKKKSIVKMESYTVCSLLKTHSIIMKRIVREDISWNITFALFVEGEQKIAAIWPWSARQA